MPNYYDNIDYVSEKKMKEENYTKEEKTAQKETNWWIRLEYYATHRYAVEMYLNKFIKMAEKWLNDNERLLARGDAVTLTRQRSIAQMALGMKNRGGWGANDAIPKMLQTHKRMEAELEADLLHAYVMEEYIKEAELQARMRAVETTHGATKCDKCKKTGVKLNPHGVWDLCNACTKKN
jgi:hypothetical protein